VAAHVAARDRALAFLAMIELCRAERG